MVVDQEAVIREFKNQGNMTARLLFNISCVLAKAAADRAVDIGKMVSTKIETMPGEKKSIDALKKRVDTLDYNQFSNNEMNLDKLKAYLKEYGIQFHAEELANGNYNYWFKSKDQKQFQAALERVKEDIINDKKQIKSLQKSPKDLKPQEQIAKHKAAAPKQSVGTKVKKPTKSV